MLLGPRRAEQAENQSLAHETLPVGAATENFERERKSGCPRRRPATNENLGGENALVLHSRAGENEKSLAKQKLSSGH
jgi:hypothetical protein